MRQLIGWILALTLGLGLAAPQGGNQAELQLKAAMHREQVEGDPQGAIEQYRRIIEQYAANNRKVTADALVRMALCYEKLGSTAARQAYERVLKDYADQKDAVSQAQAGLAKLNAAETARQSPAPGVTVRQVWASAPRYGAQGAPSRDGSYLTFKTESADLAVRDLATGQIRQLTKHQDSRQSAWNSIPSPDGKQIAYLWRDDLAWELRVVGLDGAEPRVLCRKAEATDVRPFPADWSPDGRSILIVLWHALAPGSEIALVSVRDGSMRILKDFDKRLTEHPRFSPDGRFIVYDRQQRPGSRERDIFVLALDGGRDIPLVEYPADDAYPDWTPDGKGIVFFSDRTGTTGAWWIQVAEGSPRGTPELLKPDLRADQHMGFSRNGSYYYSVGTEMTDVYIAEVDLAAGKLISAPKAATQRFIGYNGAPEWSPDGRQLLFVSKRGPGVREDRWGPCVLSSENGEVRELVSKFDRIRHVRWAPDGRSLLASAGSGVFRIDVETGDSVPIPLQSEAIWLPTLSHDAKAIFYQAAFKETRKYCVMVRDIETGKDQELFCIAPPTRFVSRLALSPNGRQLAFVISEEGTAGGPKVLKVIQAAGGEARDVLRGLQMPVLENPIAWAPDGSSLLFIKPLGQTPNSKTELWSISVRGGEPRKLELAVEGMIDISIHPDGRHIAFTSARNRDEIWVVENFLPPASNQKK